MERSTKVEQNQRPAEPEVLDALTHLRRTYEGIHTNRMRNTDQGHWINEAFVVRLFAVLEAHGIVGSDKEIDFSLAGSDSVNACRRLRNKIAHSTARIGSADSKKLDRTLKKVFGFGEQQSMFEKKFILSKDTVLRPMWKQCCAYCEELLDKERAAQNKH